MIRSRRPRALLASLAATVALLTAMVARQAPSPTVSSMGMAIRTSA